MPFELRPSRSSDSNRSPTSITSDQALENFNRVLSQAIASHFRNSLPSPLRDNEMDTANHSPEHALETDNPSDLASTMDLTEFLGTESDEESSETRSSLQHTRPNHSSDDSEMREAPRAWQNFVDITLDEEVASLASDELLPFPPTTFSTTEGFAPDRQSHADIAYQPLTSPGHELINTDGPETSLMSEDEEGSLLRRPGPHTNAENDVNSTPRSTFQQNTTVFTLPLQSFPSLGRRRVGRDPHFYTHLLTRPYTPPPIPNRSSASTSVRTNGLPRAPLSTLSSPLPPLHRGLNSYQPRSISPSASSSETSAISASSSPSLLPRRPLSPSPSPPPRRRKVSYDDSDIDDELPIQPAFSLQSLYEISRHPTKPCSFLQPGRVFLGEQCLQQGERVTNRNHGRTTSASSSLSPTSDRERSTERVIRRFYDVDSSELNSHDTRNNSFASSTSNNFGRPRPFFQSLLQSRQPRDRDRSPVRSTGEQELKVDDRWEVKVTLHTVDLDAGVLTGLMEALNVPAMGATTVVTSWEGEIVDGCTNSLWTGKWNAEKDTDLKHWRRMLEEIEDLPQESENERIERGRALTRALKSGEIPCYVSERYILMRWKERSFVNITPQEAGLTIAGFYYVLLRRSDGVVRGFYHDPHSAPFQRLELSVVPEGRGFGFGRFAFA